MAAPAHLFIKAFRSFLPVCLGPAAHAMIWMMLPELFPEVSKKVDSASAVTAVTLAFSAVMAFHMIALAH